MKQIFVIILLFLSATSDASQKAITDTGEEVILNDDGTWHFPDKLQKVARTLKTNKEKFKRPSDSSFLLKSVKNDSAYWINTNKWSFAKATDNAQAEYQFELKGKDLYGMAITEGIEISIESLANIAFTNAKNVAPDTKIDRKEYRIVNGKKVIYMEMSGTMQGIKFTYLSHYYSDTSGATQLVTYTAANLVDMYQTEINDFLNGLITQ
jgi:hypothetical protein